MRKAPRKVRFLRAAAQTRAKRPSPNTQSQDLPTSTMAQPQDEFEPFMTVPSHLFQWPPILDTLSTATSELQARTIRECLPFLTAVHDPSSDPFDFNEFGLHYLNRSAHIDFVQNGLQSLPAQFVALDASRPWLMYWSLMSLYILDEDVSVFRSSIIETFKPLQNVSGGFGGGQGHLSHLAGTYAVILAITLVGGSEAYNIIDRVAMWHWLGKLKQAEGGFRVCEDGEEDVRGAYCALVAITLLDLPFELPNDSPARAKGLTDFRDGLGEYLSRCQTYEGGVAASPSNEAHGAYTFCALACLCILGPPQETIARYLDLHLLIQWLSARQYAPEGGFAGRTNKLVDGCYSHWIGGCWPLVEAAIDGSLSSGHSRDAATPPRLFSGEALTRYILGCCQAQTGGLRDKPSKRPDAYHTCYNLAGLSMAQYQHYYSNQYEPDTDLLIGVPKRTDLFRASDDQGEHHMDEVVAFQPVYVVPHAALQRLSQWTRSNKASFKDGGYTLPSHKRGVETRGTM